MPKAGSYCEDLCGVVVLCLKLLWQNIKKMQTRNKESVFLGWKNAMKIGLTCCIASLQAWNMYSGS